MERVQIDAELQLVHLDFRTLVEGASRSDLRRRSNGTRWTNRQLLYHMVFGYLIVATLLPLVHQLGRLGWSRRFAATLEAGARPFHAVNYLGSVAGGQLLPPAAMAALLDRTLRRIRRRLVRETEADLALAMHFPTSWDPYFLPVMSVREVYHYGTQHYDHHRRQLSLAAFAADDQ